MRYYYWIIPAVFVLFFAVVKKTDGLSAKSLNSNATTSAVEPQKLIQLAKKRFSSVIKSNGSQIVAASNANANRKRQIPKSRGLDQEVSASFGRNKRQNSYHQQSDKKPKSYNYKYDSGPQYYESTSKPVRYHHEYHSPPSSYHRSYNSGPQGYSYNSPPQQSSHRDSYSHQDGNEYRDGDSQSYGGNDDDGGGGDYGASNYESDDNDGNHNEYENDDQRYDIEY